MKSSEVALLREKVPAIRNIAFETDLVDKVEYGSSVLSNVWYYGVSEDFFNIQTVDLYMGRALQQRDFDQATNSILMGNNVATQLFGKPENALDKQVQLRNGKIGIVVGIVKKQGSSIMEMWRFDDGLLLPNRSLAQMI